ncbi:carbon catabolite repressor protein 4 homolog 6 isoform X3 [Typha latifolia]|uniref:carbon catabolite repressor protein 4 homolog 6 isoform X3 n=1 Tax=Typha latifolia TaxID=4733 RepID=UPI003C2FDF38
MRFTSPSLHSVAASATNSSMSSSSSSRFNARGRNPWRRGFCDRGRPPAPEGGDDGVFVSGDSHIKNVRDANYEMRHGQRGGAGWVPRGAPRQSYRPRIPYFRPPPQWYGPPPAGNGHPPPYCYPPAPGFGPPPPSYGPPATAYGAPTISYGPFPPPKVENPQPPQPRLADYRRDWCFASSQPPPQSERFLVLSYNILADYLAREHQSKLYFHIPNYILDWEWRKKRLLFEFGLWSPDVICLQEVDKFHELKEELAIRGYSGIWKMRTGNAIDGCAIFWRDNRFQLRHEEQIEFNKLGLRNNVAQICVLESRIQGPVGNDSASLPSSSNQSRHANQVVVCNIHVLYNPKRGEIKIGQVRTLLDQAYTVSKLWNDAPVIICGDFNCTPKSPLYNFISEQKLNLSGLARTQVSGQYSANSSARRPYAASNFSNSHPSVAYSDNKEIISKVGRNNCDNFIPQDDMANANLESNPNSDTSHIDANGSQDLAPEIAYCSKECSGRAQNEIRGEDMVTDTPFSDILNSQVLKSNSTEVVDSMHKDLSLENHEFSECSDSSLVEKDISDPEISTKFSWTLSSESSNESSLCGEAAKNHLASESIQDKNVISAETSCDVIQEIFVDVKLFALHGMESSKDLTAEKERADPLVSGQRTCDNGMSEVSNCCEFLGKFPDLSLGEIKDANSYGYHGNFVSTNCETIIPKAVSNDYAPNQLEFEETIKYSGDSASSFGLSLQGKIPDGNPEGDCIFHDISSSHENSDPNFYKELLGSEDPQECQNEMFPTSLGQNNSLSCKNLQKCSSLFIDTEEDPCGANLEKFTYNPYLWTPMEIKAASGDEECTAIEHNMKLRSAYTDAEQDYAGTKDSTREPQVTSYNRQFMGTVDYIWYSEGLQTVKVLDTLPKHVLQQTSGFPTKKWGSDHIALVCQLAFANGLSTK